MIVEKGTRSMYSVSKEEHLREIYTAKYEIQKLKAALFHALRLNNNVESALISSKINKLKKNIRKKYNVLLD